MLKTLSLQPFPSYYLTPMVGPWSCAYCCQVACMAPIVLFWHRGLAVHLLQRRNALPYHVPRPCCQRCSLDITLPRLWNARWEAEAGDLYAGTPIDWNVVRMRIEWGALGNYGN